MPEDTPLAIVSIKMPQDLYERLKEMRWNKRAPSVAEVMRDLLRQGVSQHEKGNETQAEMAQSGA